MLIQKLKIFAKFYNFRNQVRLMKHPDLIRLIRLFHQYFLTGDNVDSGGKIFQILF